MRWLAAGALVLSLCACGRLAQYGDPRLRKEPDAAAAAPASAPTEIAGKGTVRRVDDDGGFWGLRTDDGHSYRLEALPPVYQKDGTRIRFRGRVRGGVLDLVDVSGV